MLKNAKEARPLRLGPWPKTTTLVESGHRNRVNDRLSNMPSAARLAENNAVTEIAASRATLALALHPLDRSFVSSAQHVAQD